MRDEEFFFFDPKERVWHIVVGEVIDVAQEALVHKEVWVKAWDNGHLRHQVGVWVKDVQEARLEDQTRQDLADVQEARLEDQAHQDLADVQAVLIFEVS